jgi:hypothetical protein
MAIKGATAIKTKSSPTMGLADPAYKEQAKQFGEEKRKAGEETLGAINLLEQDVAQQEGEIAKAKYEQEKTKLAATQKAEEEYAGTTRGLYERAATLEEKYPFPTYKPTQEDALSYAQLGSMVVTLGMMLGGGAKASGKSALASMTGMINGWREGKQDLWRREAQQFDKDMQRIKSEREAIQKNLEKGLKLAATDRKAAQTYIDMASHIAGQGVVQAMINKGRPIAALKHLQETLKFQQKTFDEIENRAIAQQRHEQLMKAQEAQRQATLQAAQTKAEAKTGAGMLKPGAEVTKNYLGINALVEDMKDISTKLKDPKIRKMIDDYRLEGFASEELGKIGAQIANDQLPSELRQFLVKIRNIRNNYYLTISGKAVTGGEALRNYGVVSQPGDSAAVMSDKTDAMLSQANRSINQYRTLYGLPAIDSDSINQLRATGKDGTFDVRQLPVEDQQENIIDVPGKGKFRKLPNGNFEKVD